MASVRRHISDDDLGRSAAGTWTRAGFERVVVEVCLGKVGAVAAREMSRFIRNGRAALSRSMDVAPHVRRERRPGCQAPN
jgi:hypothetical protein